MENETNKTWNADLPRMDTEFKVAIFLYFFLVAVSAMLLKFLAHIPVASPEFRSGFLPFMFLLLPYILFSSNYFAEVFGRWMERDFYRKLLVPLYLILIYSIFNAASSNFSLELFVKLSLWFFVPTLIFCTKWGSNDGLSLASLSAALILWLPIEFGKLAGFDIVFNKDITIPALPFAAPALGLYLFTILRRYSGIGFSFKLKLSDLGAAAVGILVLAPLLIPLGTTLGFIRFSTLDVSFWKVIELFLGIYFMVALPEELLFRGIFQNLLMKSRLAQYGKWLPLLAAAILFGFSHYNNFNPPDWRYVFLATIAGLVYGAVYIRTGKTTASALVHTGVNFCWAVLFKDSNG